jgi:hypothetical protein
MTSDGEFDAALISNVRTIIQLKALKIKFENKGSE